MEFSQLKDFSKMWNFCKFPTLLITFCAAEGRIQMVTAHNSLTRLFNFSARAQKTCKGWRFFEQLMWLLEGAYRRPWLCRGDLSSPKPWKFPELKQALELTTPGEAAWRISQDWKEKAWGLKVTPCSGWFQKSQHEVFVLSETPPPLCRK